jgi:dienelactone hydrolase
MTVRKKVVRPVPSGSSILGMFALVGSIVWGAGYSYPQTYQPRSDVGHLVDHLDPAARVLQHRVTIPQSPAPEPGAEHEEIPSLVVGLERAQDWWQIRRPQLLGYWIEILGKIDPNEQDQVWFGDICNIRVGETTDLGAYTRTELFLPIEKDFFQPHLLLIPKGQGEGPFPAVIAWSSTSPDYREPERWWGSWLASRGYVVLTGWSFIRNYRDGTDYSSGAHEKVYQRFGHWLAMGKMVHDVKREFEFLRCRPEVDPTRVGFIGKSLSAKAALYVAAFSPDIAVTVSIDPHIAVNGGTNWFEPWYLDWLHEFEDISTKSKTPLSLLNPDPVRPGFEHDHHEVLALAAPRPLLVIGGSQVEDTGGDSDDLQSWGYVNRAKEVYRLVGAGERLEYVSTDDGHNSNGPHITPAWQGWFERWLKQ